MSKIYPNRNTAKSELLDRIRKDRSEIEQWIKMPIDQPYLNNYIKLPNYSLEFFRFMLSHLGGTGNLSIKLRNIAMDLDQSGVVSVEEFDSNQEAQALLIDQALTLLTTMGVVGALIFSVLFSTVLNPLSPSEVSTRYFTPYTMVGFTYTYYACVYLALGRSFVLIFQSVIMYLKLGFWMPDLSMKMWYLSTTSLKKVVYNGVISLLAASLALPCGKLCCHSCLYIYNLPLKFVYNKCL